MRDIRGIWRQLLGWGLLALLAIWLIAPHFISDLVLLILLVGVAAVVGRAIMRASQPQKKDQSQSSWLDALTKPPLSSREIAERAMAKVGRHSAAGGINLKDIGILAYDGGKQPRVSRTETIPALATHLRPYIVLDLAILKGAHGRIQFDLVDATGQIRFTSNDRYKLQPGENFITTSNWQPMGDDEPGGNWYLRVSVGEQPLAIHDFKITPDSGSQFRTYMRNDGEIDEWLSKAAKLTTTQEISLDDLLADQEEISAEMFTESKR
ncbi:MAG: hypothetical protein KF726_09405 [Anaerolineae bacterium]|nr:hypothetical protein [Anaerolineae bacterium]